MKAGRCFALAVAVPAVFAAARPFGFLGPTVLSVSILTAALALIAWSSGATSADLGLGRADVRAGLLYGAGALGIVLLVLVVAAVIPATNGFLHVSRAQISGGRLLYEIGVPIVVSLDIHSYVTQETFETVDLVFGGHYYPETDTYDRGYGAGAGR